MAPIAYIESLLFVKIIVWERAYKTTFNLYLFKNKI